MSWNYATILIFVKSGDLKKSSLRVSLAKAWCKDFDSTLQGWLFKEIIRRKSSDGYKCCICTFIFLTFKLILYRSWRWVRFGVRRLQCWIWVWSERGTLILCQSPTAQNLVLCLPGIHSTESCFVPMAHSRYLILFCASGHARYLNLVLFQAARARDYLYGWLSGQIPT